MWTLLNNLTDITTSEPTTSSSDWLAMYGMLEYPSIRPSLLLDFYSKEIDPRITFSRASDKTYYDHKCRLCYADVDEPTIDHDPVTGECKGLSIWESRTNLLTYSEDFDNAAWVKTRSAVVPNAITAPDGSLTAYKLVDNTANAEHYMQQMLTQTEGTFTKSLYVKKGNSGDYVEIRPVHIGEISPTSAIKFDLNVGPLATTNVLITNAGMDILLDGWRRCWVTYTTTAACTEHRARVNLISSTGDNRTYTGDGTSGIYIWGAQLEEGNNPSSYIPTPASFISRASTATYFDTDGVMQTAAVDEARYTYNPADLTAPATLLLEHTAATNKLTYSEEFDNVAWTKQRITIVPNAAVASDGTLTADKLVESTDTGEHYAQQTVTVSAATTYTNSWYVQAAELDSFRIRIYSSPTTADNVNVDFKGLSLGLSSVVAPASFGSAAVIDSGSQDVGGGVYRLWVTFNMGNSDTSVLCRGLLLNSIYATSYTGDGTSGLYIWGAQLEEGTYPTSYIPTTSAPVTRAADISTSTATTRAADVAYIDGTDFSDFYNQQEGTVVVGFDKNSLEESKYLASLTDGTTANQINFFWNSGQDLYSLIKKDNIEFNAQKLLDSDDFESKKLYYCALSISNTTMLSAFEGASQVDTIDITPVPVNRLVLGNNYGLSYYALNGHIRHLAYYPKALTDNNLIALTTEE
jgi:hypothetical protein